MCRVYAGIHFLHDVTDGRIVGNQVSNILSVLQLLCFGLPVQVSSAMRLLLHMQVIWPLSAMHQCSVYCVHTAKPVHTLILNAGCVC